VNTPIPKIVVTGRIPDSGIELLRGVGDVWTWAEDDPIPMDALDEQLANADAAVTLLSERVDDRFLAAAPHIGIVANVAVGYNNIDVEACTARGVRVTNTPGVLTDATADLTMGLLLAVTRRLGEGERLIRSGTPWKWGMFMMLGTGLQGRRLGIVGMGDIGQAVASRARAFGMDIVYHNRSSVDPETQRRLGARLVSLDELFATSDVVSLNCPYTDATHHLVDADALAMMRPSAFLLNSARGPIVDEAALVDALRSSAIAGAGLDVFEHEPDVHPGLLDLDNVVLVPHLGSATTETRGAMAELAARNVVAHLRGDPLPTPVN
jgi:glyoxylate reductase